MDHDEPKLNENEKKEFSLERKPTDPASPTLVATHHGTTGAEPAAAGVILGGATLTATAAVTLGFRAASESRVIIGAVATGSPPENDVKLPEFRRLWTLVSFAFSRDVRERIYEPAHQELLEDLIRAQAISSGKWAKRWLIICFTVRSFIMVAQSLGVSLGDKGSGILKKLFLAVLGAEAVKSLRDFFFELFGKV
jgi:hypothetical protein